MEEYLSQLNDSQRAAVTYIDGPALVIAGAGSGKTRVLTYKIAYLLNQGIPPYAILALTFTNKAAREMKERIASVVGEQVASRLWMGTFHSLFSRILRSEAESIGYPSNFTIYDSTDSKSLLKAIIKEMQLDDKTYRPGMVQGRISNAKNALITWRAYEQNKELVEYDIKAKVPLIREIYKRYQSRCLQAGAMDFDDLLLNTNILFRDHPAVLDKYRQFFQYILVDEYQDTNFAQHLIVQRLSEAHGRITVVGDDAQSIYSFRGANIDNILQLKKVYPGCRTFKLERNYRSTQNIVNAANSLIHKNKEQIQKTVYSENAEGEKVQAFASYSDYEEGYAVASKIEGMRNKKEYDYADFAILYRTNAQSRILEEALRKRGIPYKIYGGLSFYQRKEIKDVIAYFRIIINPHDEEALKRIINYPARGIGETTVGKLITAANQYNTSLWSILKEPLSYAVSINGGTAKKLSDFRELMDSFILFSQTNSAEEVAAHIVKQSGIFSLMVQDQSVEGISKRENLEELLKGIAEFVQIRREEGMDRVSLADFLSDVALLTDQDNAKEEQTNKVTLMTVHAAKGLEFKNVFVVGLEEDLFPSQMAKDNIRAIEEERRLFYVAITRAEENCVLSYAKSRFRNGKTAICSPSRFLKDIDKKYLDLPEDTSLSNDTFSLREKYQRPAFQSPFQQPKAVDTSSSITQPQRSRLKRIEPERTVQPNTSGMEVSGLQVGFCVRHERFGEGKVIAIEGDGGNTKATVEFTHFGQKQLLLKFAKLIIL
ncbi:ATP-dependent DNA helicase [Parabacteroides sp. 52]|uniref:ATP-dependent helicase n=1 Tax=unclassified Parabacteroides TaxID=2649774 RepID=UPI0013D7B724|nr:UvrD-helicase domain-containing protein [Parabacteroides sp. PM5-20]MDH6533445.1 DNA helicase-2/ATP-dependent DNA helicase PcrA [Parabacteroides sp. PM5-20]NDV54202.1 ATP-dependent DNA helicase [Parabacteroides sp. 52]